MLPDNDKQRTTRTASDKDASPKNQEKVSSVGTFISSFHSSRHPSSTSKLTSTLTSTQLKRYVVNPADEFDGLCQL